MALSNVFQLMHTGKTLCKYGPVFAPNLHDWTLYIRYKYIAKMGPYLHGVFPVACKDVIPVFAAVNAGQL